MIRIYVETTELDISKEVSVLLQKELFSEDNVEMIAEFSYNIDIPTTENNRKAFCYWDVIDVPGKFNNTFRCRLYADEILIVDGRIRVSEITKDYYKCNIYNPSAKSLSDILGDKTMNQIAPHMKPMNKIEDYTRNNNWVLNLSKDNNELPEEQYRDNHIVYPYVLWNLPWNASSITDSGSFDDNENKYVQVNNMLGYDSNNILPAYNVLSVLKDVFKTYGYDVKGNVFDDDRFSKLYQTFSYDYEKYIDEKEVPYYVDISVNYSNYRGGVVSDTLRIDDLWEDYERDVKNEHFDGIFRYGVDDLLEASDRNVTVTVNKNEYDMYYDSSAIDENGDKKTTGRVISIPKSGWYKVRLSGSMLYPDKSDKYYKGENFYVGGTTNRADNTTLAEQPFEIQLKRGYPSTGQLYSNMRFLPGGANHYSKNYSVLGKDKDTYIVGPYDIVAEDSQYPKNNGTIILKDLSGFDIGDFICGARLGGAWFSDQWTPASNEDGAGKIRRPNRFALKGAGMALPRPKKMDIKEINGDNYFRIAKKKTNKDDEYAAETALAIVHPSTYSNCPGYNVMKTDGSWDTTSNPRKITYPGAEDSVITPKGEYAGDYTVNTVVWLEKGEQLYLEALMPVNTWRSYQSGNIFQRSKWLNPKDLVNITNINCNLKVGYINNNKDWIPTNDSPIPSDSDLLKPRLNNVNRWLPSDKVNDWIENLLKTLNLKLTYSGGNTFNIDYNAFAENIYGNKIDIDPYVNAYDAIFKPIEAPTRREIAWKIDQEEKGWVTGNDSPFLDENDRKPFDEKEYDGSLAVVNEANTQNSVDRFESKYSYPWYTTICFRDEAKLPCRTRDVLIMMSNQDWEESNYFLVFQSAGNKKAMSTARTPRLFYIWEGEAEYLYEWRSYDGNQLNILPVAIPHRFTQDNFLIDYKSVDGFTSIGDSLFSLKETIGYEVEVEGMLPNFIYDKIKPGTIGVLNAGQYKFSKIEGHDVSGLDNAYITLRSLS